MGCTGSKQQADGEPKLKPGLADASTQGKIPPVEEKKIFIGVSPKQIILCRDEFQSKYTEELMYRWRPAEILKVEGDNRNEVLVHYTGWAETFDHWVNLEEEFTKLAPENLLSKDQCNRGDALTEEQAEITLDYFLHGREYTPFEEPTETVVEQQHNNSISVSNSEDATQRAIEAALKVSRLPTVPLTAPATPAPVKTLSSTPAPASVMTSSSTPVIAARRVSTTPGSLCPPGEEGGSGKNSSSATSMSVPTAILSPAETSKELPVAPTEPVYVAPLPLAPLIQPSSSTAKKILAPVRLSISTPVTTTKNPFYVHDKVDVLDIFFKRGSTTPSQKWRHADIVEVVGDYVTIHYHNWDDKYNERLHYIKDAHRLGASGTRVQRSAGGHSSSSHSLGGNSHSNHTSGSGSGTTGVHTSGSSVVSGGGRSHMSQGSHGSHVTSSRNSHSNENLRTHTTRGDLTGSQTSARRPSSNHNLTGERSSYTTSYENQNQNRYQSPDEWSEVYKGAGPLGPSARRMSASSAPAYTYSDHSAEREPVALPATPSTDHAASELTPEQRNFTRNFHNYQQKKQAEIDAATADEEGEGEAGDNADASKNGASTEKAADKSTDKPNTMGERTGEKAAPEKFKFRKGLSKITFGGLFGSAKEGVLAAPQVGNKQSSLRGSLSKSASVEEEEEESEYDQQQREGEEREEDIAVAEAVEETERDEEAIAARERNFLERLEAKGLHVFAIEGDGNCLFRAVSHQLYLEQDMHDELRARCVEHLIRHRKRFEVFCEGDFDEHLKEMSKSGTWGDDLEIRALEEITDRVITIYSSNVENVEEPLNNNFEERSLLQGVPPLTLSYHGQSHYNSIYDENYPLPLTERKSRLLLRSRLALTQIDLLPDLAPLPPLISAVSSQSSDATSSRHASPRHSVNGRSQQQHDQSNQQYNQHTARSGGASSSNSVVSAHMNQSYDTYDTQYYSQHQSQHQPNYLQHPPHPQQMHNGHSGHFPHHAQHLPQLPLHQNQAVYGYQQQVYTPSSEYGSTPQAVHHEADSDYADYDSSLYADSGYEQPPEIYEQPGYEQDYRRSDYVPSNQLQQSNPYMYTAYGNNQHQPTNSNFNYGYQQNGKGEYHHSDGYQ